MRVYEAEKRRLNELIRAGATRRPRVVFSFDPVRGGTITRNGGLIARFPIKSSPAVSVPEPRPLMPSRVPRRRTRRETAARAAEEAADPEPDPPPKRRTPAEGHLPAGAHNHNRNGNAGEYTASAGAGKPVGGASWRA